MTRFTNYRWASAVLTAFGLFATTVAGQPPRPAAPLDPLATAKAQQKVAEQKAEADILQTIDNANKLAQSNRTAKAAQHLKAAKQNIQFAVGISDAARTRFTEMLDAKLAAIEGRPAANTKPNPVGVQLDPRGAEVKAAQKEVIAKYSAELKDVREGIERVEKYQDKGEKALADAEITRLAKAYPYNPSVMALGQKDSISDRLADAQAHYAAMSERWVKNQMDINRSSLPAIMDVEFPKDWKEKSERRLKAFRVQLTAKEEKLIEALDKPISISWVERPLEEALQDLSNTLDQPLLVDKKSLEDLGLDLKRGVSFQGKGLSGRTVLRSILATQGLTFVVKDEAIQIVTIERSKTLLTTRVYYLGDLVQGVGAFGGIEWGPFLNTAQTQTNVAVLIEAIRKIDPLSWDGRDTGGPGSITYHAPSQSIIVRNSAEVHFTLGNALYGKKK